MRHEISKLIRKSTATSLYNVSLSTFTGFAQIPAWQQISASQKKVLDSSVALQTSLFQAELLANYSALEWIEKRPDILKISIFSENLFRLNAINTPRAKNSLVRQIKVK